MQIQIELWHLITLAITVIGAYAAVAKALMVQVTKGIDDKFAVVTKLIEALSQQGEKYRDDVLRLERELGALRLEMMRDFTRREDHNQAIASIRVGLDNMSLRIEKALSTGGHING